MIRLALPLMLLAAAPALAQSHSGAVERRTMPQLSDMALVAMAAGGLWYARRAMRAKKRQPKARVED